MNEPSHIPVKGHRAIDPTLNQIAWRLNTLKWQFPLTEDELQAAHSVLHNIESPKHLMSPMPDYKTWAIRLYLGGAQRIIGFIKQEDLTAGLRYADMARVHFWPYRVRGPHKPAEHELNFSLERAEMDLQAESEAIQLLKDIEGYLHGIGALLTGEQVEEVRRTKKAVKSFRHTVRGELIEINDHWLSRVQGLEQEVAALTVKQEKALEEIRRVNTFLEKLVSLAAAPPPAPMKPVDAIGTVLDPLPMAPDTAKPFSLSLS